MNHLDLFTGIMGFALAAKWVWGDAHNMVAFCEKDKLCQKLIGKKYPGIPIIPDIRDLMKGDIFDSIDIISGGDPCPARSKARRHPTILHPDLSGYFLAVCGRCRPRWILRENVPASDDIHFTAALELLGYRTIIIRTDAAPYTGQQRIRDIIVASTIKGPWESQFFELDFRQSNGRNYTPKLAQRPHIACLTTHRTRYDSRDCYIYEGDQRLRVLDGDERVRFSGFPQGWLNGFSESAIARMTGNVLVPQCVKPIMQCIKQIEDQTKKETP
jgi:site-specific DNA-cytosine methylase